MRRDWTRLTVDERATLLAVACGKGYEEAAAQLCVSVSAVRSAVMRIHAILGAATSVHALAIAVARNIISADDLRDALKERSE